MSHLKKTALFGAAIGLLGLVLSFFPTVHDLEEDLGLGLLFKLRGAVKPPVEVLVISMDRESSERLNLSPNPDRWPRSIHAALINRLTQLGAQPL